MQVLAQLHGIPAEEDGEEEQQEDVPSGSRSLEHRRPRSAGNLAEQASNSSAASHKTGRPPLAETTVNNKLGLKVWCSQRPGAVAKSSIIICGFSHTSLLHVAQW